MKKLRCLLLILCCMLFAGALAACGGGETYICTFDSRGGTAIEAYTLGEGDEIARPAADPQKSLFSFTGWFEDEKCTRAFDFSQRMPAHDITIYAGWNPERSSRVEYDSLGGTDVGASVGLVGSAFTAPADPTREGYRFGGWFKDAGCTDPFSFTVYPEESCTLYARWDDDPSYAYITFVGNGKTMLRLPVKKGETVTEPEKEDLFGSEAANIELTGWYSDRQLQTEYSFGAASSDVSVYAGYRTAGLEITGGKVVKYTGEAAKSVFVPEYSDNSPVTAIEKEAFASHDEIRSIDLPQNLMTVGEKAFYRCRYLEQVNLPKTVTSIGAHAFFECERLTSYGDVTGVAAVPEGLFLGCKKLPAVRLSESATSVGAQAFADCEALREAVIPDRVSAIPAGLFDGCAALERVTLPAKLATFGDRVFKGCASLKTIVLPVGNAHFKLTDGNLYHDNKLLRYVAGEKGETAFTLPAGIASVEKDAFDGNATLETLTFGQGTTLACGALAGMQALTSLTLPDLGTDGYLAYFFGASAAESGGNSSHTIPKTLRTVTLTGSVSAVAANAFFGAVGLEEIRGLSAITSVGEHAFAYTALKRFEIPSSLTDLQVSAFTGCTALEEFVLTGTSSAYTVFDGCLYSNGGQGLLRVPAAKTSISFASGMTTIKADAFMDSQVEEIVLPDTVATLEFGALRGCGALVSLTAPFLGGSDSQNNYMGYVFGANMNISDQTDDADVSYKEMSVTNGNYVCTTLRSITLKKKYTEIPDRAFALLVGLSEVHFPEGNAITSIGAYAFAATAISAWDFTGVTTVGDFAFRESALKEIDLPGRLTFGYGAFSQIEGIESITLHEGITEIAPQSFFAVYESNEDAADGVAFMSDFSNAIVIPSTVTKIGRSAFYGIGRAYNSGTSKNDCNPGVSLRFALKEDGTSALTEIGDSAFQYAAIPAAEIPASVTKIGARAFSSCAALETVSFGSAEKTSSLATFGDCCFENCTALESFTMYVTSVITMPLSSSQDIFAGASARFLIYLPHSVIEQYRAADNWKKYTNRMHEIGE